MDGAWRVMCHPIVLELIAILEDNIGRSYFVGKATLEKVRSSKGLGVVTC